MTFTLVGAGGNCNGCEWIAADGDITRDSHKHIAHLIHKSGVPLGQWNIHVVLNSSGGDLLGALLLGETIRRLGLSTDVGQSVGEGSTYQQVKGSCMSACAFAFLGGAWRSLSNGSQYGVHQFYDARALVNPNQKIFTAIDTSVNQLLTGLVLDYVVRMGVDARLVSLASSTSPFEIRTLSESEATALRVVWMPDEFGPWHIEPRQNGLVAFSRTQDEQKVLTLFCEADGRKYILYSRTGAVVDAGQRAITDKTVHATRTIHVLGAQLLSAQVSTKVEGSTFLLRLPLPAAFRLDLSAPVRIESGPDAGRPNMWWITVNSTGLESASRLAFRNCI